MLPERMKELRKMHRMTQEELAVQIGVSLGAIKYWEQGRGEPNVAALVSMAVLFNVSLDYLVGRSPIRELVVDDNQTKKLIEVVNDLPDHHREALYKYAELLKGGKGR